ncbi:Hypothetical predicted protein [Paramuricea clavata]|uniref:Uncharacterized protein n=1 Tax=Paramuricea clavata TaxID=317549 RepID=A0A6S7G045_PARCT|nr:Hypothetical predicted protein [Paramuricea clavata]
MPYPDMDIPDTHTPQLEWQEQFAKFYIEKNDDWTHMSKVLRVFVAAVDAELDDLTAAKLVPAKQLLPPPPAPTPAKDKEVEKDKKKPSEKKRKVELDSDDETKRAMCTIIVMKHHSLSAKEAVLIYCKEMNEEYLFDYLDLIKNDGDLQLDRIYKELLDKNLI